MGVEYWVTNDGELDDDYVGTVSNLEGWPVLPMTGTIGHRARQVFDGPVGDRIGDCSWDGTDADGRRMSSGVYFYLIAAGGQEATGKMVLAKQNRETPQARLSRGSGTTRVPFIRFMGHLQVREPCNERQFAVWVENCQFPSLKPRRIHPEESRKRR